MLSPTQLSSFFFFFFSFLFTLVSGFGCIFFFHSFSLGFWAWVLSFFLFFLLLFFPFHIGFPSCIFFPFSFHQIGKSMNQRGNYKHQTHTKKTHIPTNYKHQTHSKDIHIATYYKHQINIPTYRRRCWLLEGEIGIGDQRCLYSKRKREPVSGYWGESDEKKRGMYTWVWCSGSGSRMGPTKSRKF